MCSYWWPVVCLESTWEGMLLSFLGFLIPNNVAFVREIGFAWVSSLHQERIQFADTANHGRLIAAMSLIGATMITTFCGPVSDIYGRRPMLIISAIMYFISGLVMVWAPNVYILLLGRIFHGFGTGLAVTLVPLYISETAPSEIRGLLNTFPQFMGSG